MRRLITRFILLFALALLCVPAAPNSAEAQRRRRSKATRKKSKKPKGGKVKVFDFTGLDLTGQLRAPQLLYFLDRAREELERASLERRSFIPEMVRSISEEDL